MLMLASTCVEGKVMYPGIDFKSSVLYVHCLVFEFGFVFGVVREI